MADEERARIFDRNGGLPQEVAEGLVGVGGLEGLRAGLPEESVIRALAERHQALSDVHRLSIMYLLKGSELCPCVLKDLTGLSDSKLSYHLGILERAGMVAWRQNKNWRVYSLTELGNGSLS